MDTQVTQISKRHLKELFSRFNKLGLEVGLCGGWAVHFSLQKLGVPHLDSEDIDIFFKPSKTPVGKVVEVIESLGFVRSEEITWTWRKYFDKKTGEDVAKGKWEKLPYDRQGTFYIDVLPTESMRGYLEEELYDFAFGEEHEFVELEGAKILIPTSRLLVSVKSRSAPQRQFTRKKIKDIADIYAIVKNDDSVWLRDKNNVKKMIEINYENKKFFADNINDFLATGILGGVEQLLEIREENEVYETLKKAYIGGK